MRNFEVMCDNVTRSGHELKYLVLRFVIPVVLNKLIRVELIF